MTQEILTQQLKELQIDDIGRLHIGHYIEDIQEDYSLHCISFFIMFKKTELESAIIPSCLEIYLVGDFAIAAEIFISVQRNPLRLIKILHGFEPTCLNKCNDTNTFHYECDESPIVVTVKTVYNSDIKAWREGLFCVNELELYDHRGKIVGVK